MWSFFGKMQHDVQHAKSSPSIKRDIYNCENRFSETENLLLNNNLSKVTQTLSEGIALEYNEYVAILKFNMSGRSFTGTQWNQIATIPEEVKPKERGLYFALIDNAVNSNATNNPIFARIDTDGKVYIYAFSDRTTLAPVGSVTYII